MIYVFCDANTVGMTNAIMSPQHSLFFLKVMQ